MEILKYMSGENKFDLVCSGGSKFFLDEIQILGFSKGPNNLDCIGREL
jgi:hypothetical protein